MSSAWIVDGTRIKARRYAHHSNMLGKLPELLDQGDEISIREVDGWAAFMVLKIGDQLRIRGRYTYDQSTAIRAEWNRYKRRAANA